MATPQYFDINGGANNYSSINAWDLAERTDLVSADKYYVVRVYGGTNSVTGTVTIYSGWTTDATRYIEITAAAGQEHTGVWNTSKAYASVSSGHCFDIPQKVVKFTKMQLRKSDTGGANVILYRFGAIGGSIDRCFVWSSSQGYEVIRVDTPNSDFYIRNCVAINDNATQGLGISTGYNSNTLYVYNCTVIGSCTTGSYALANDHSALLVSQNNYLAINGTGELHSYYNTGGTMTKGTNDATFNTEAVTPALQNIPYSTATFLSVTSGSQNLRPYIYTAGGNKLLDNGANLSGSGITEDIVGTARPQFGAFDIGAFENDVPICWNYTARYKNSNKLFKASGCGSFPRNLRVPGNVDTGTGKMIDDGIEIDPDNYSVV